MTESLTVLVTWLRARWHCTVQSHCGAISVSFPCVFWWLAYLAILWVCLMNKLSMFQLWRPCLRR